MPEGLAERNLAIRLSVIDGGKVKAELTEIYHRLYQRIVELTPTPLKSYLEGAAPGSGTRFRLTIKPHADRFSA